MGRIITPTALNNSVNKSNQFVINDLMTDIAVGEFALVIGHEVILDTNQSDFTGFDSESILIDAVVDQLEKDTNLQVKDRSIFKTFDNVVDVYKLQPTKRAILKIVNPNNEIWSFSVDDVNPDLKQLLQSGVFRTIIVTTFDPYVEVVLREKWADDLVVASLWDLTDEGAVAKYSKNRMYDAPRLYYAFGRADYRHPDRLQFVISDQDRLRTIQRLLSKNAESFLQLFRGMRLLSLGNKMDDWLFRFFWYALTQGLTDEEAVGNKVLHTFNANSESDTKLKVYLKKLNVLLSDYELPRDFLARINNQIALQSKEYLDRYNHVGGIFISYAAEDSAFALHLYNELVKAKFESNNRFHAKLK